MFFNVVLLFIIFRFLDIFIFWIFGFLFFCGFQFLVFSFFTFLVPSKLFKRLEKLKKANFEILWPWFLVFSF